MAAIPFDVICTTAISRVLLFQALAGKVYMLTTLQEKEVSVNKCIGNSDNESLNEN